MKVILGTMTFGKQVDEKTAERIVKMFLDHGHSEIDTAFTYIGGKTEEILGRILAPSLREKVYLATKVFPESPAGFRPEKVVEQVETSLKRLKTDWVDLLYLHRPDNQTPIEVTLETCQKLFRQGKFRWLGLSNYAAWQVADIRHICKQNDWVLPAAYQGIYNALSRNVEPELFPAIRNFGLKFYAYNPLAGGLLTGKYPDINKHPEDGRFFHKQFYKDRFWKASYFNALEEIRTPCKSNGISMAEAALRWLKHHSLLNAASNDGTIIGVTGIDHLKANLQACEAGELPQEIVEAYAKAAKLTKMDCPSYFR
ncbi:MAG: aldo/keto reductase [Thermodesulfobacteriota bacterium]